MATNHKVLGQAYPIGNTDTLVYTVPAATQTVVSTIHVANQSGSNPCYVKVAIVPSGETLTNKHYIAYNVSVPAYSIFAMTEGFTLKAGDAVWVWAQSGTVSFNISGAEIS